MGVISNILNAINSIWAFIKAIPGAINSLISWADSWFSSLIADVDWLIQYIESVAKSDVAYAFSIYTALYNWGVSEWNGLYKWALQSLADVSEFILQVY